ncbi:unnamed protein product, partial [Thlaspi arvense]
KTHCYEELIVLERENLRKSMEKLKAGASHIITCTRQLKVVEANIGKRSRELELKEKKLQTLSSDLDKRGNNFEATVKKRVRELEFKEKELKSLSSDLDIRVTNFEREKSEAGNLKKLVKECTEELRLKRNELTAKLDISTRIQREIESKKEQLGQVLGELRRLCREASTVQIRNKEMEEETNRKKKELAPILDQIKEAGKHLVMLSEKLESQRRLHEVQSSELESEERALERVRESIQFCNSELDLKENKVQSLNSCLTVCVQETDSKSKELGDIQKLIEQRTSELLVMHNQRDAFKLSIQELSEELVTKEKMHNEILETISRSSSEMEETAKEVKAAETQASDLNARSERFRQEIKGKEKELSLLMNQIESEGKKLVQFKREMQEETDSRKKDLVLILSQIEESGRQLADVVEQLESHGRLLEIKSVELVSKEMELEFVGESSKRFICDLEVKEKRLQALNNLITVSGEQLDLKSKELGEIQKLIEEKTNELCVLAEELHVEEKRHMEILEAICRSSSEMESAETETRVLSVKSQSLRREVEDREKELDRLKNQINSGESKLLQLRKSIQDCTTELSSTRVQVEAMKNTQREVELKKQLRQKSTVVLKNEQQPASAPINDTNQQNARETEAVIEDVLMDHGNSALLERHEVSSVLRGSLNPAEFVLELVQEEIREEVDIHDSLVENWVLLFEELAKIQREDDPELRPKAKTVATLWKRKMIMEAPKSSLEALAFLLFTVAFGLGELINQEETALLASSVAQYEHAPTLFNSLKLDIPEIVEYLITKRQYIPAVQLICAFKLDKDFPASHLLTKVIMDLRWSALERRPAESSQAKEKDGARLKAILELVEDYKLEVSLPGDLIAKLMIQRENSTPLVHYSARHRTSSASNPQAKFCNVASAQVSSASLRVPKPENKRDQKGNRKVLDESPVGLSVVRRDGRFLLAQSPSILIVFSSSSSSEHCAQLQIRLRLLALKISETKSLSKSMEKLKADASGILYCVSQLKSMHKHNEMVEANIKKRSRELELKEKELQSLSSSLDKSVRIFEKEKSEAGDLKRLVEECVEELRSTRNELTAKLDYSARIQTETELMEKQLGQYKKEMEEETGRKKSELSLVLDQIKESGKLFVTVDEQLESQQRLLKLRSSELERVRESIKLCNSDLELKQQMVQSLNNQVTVCDQTIASKSKESGDIQKLIDQRNSELVAKEKQHEKILEAICRSSSEVEEMKAAETELNVRLERFRQEIEGKRKELSLLKNQIESEEKKLEQLHSKSKELGEIQRELKLLKQLRRVSTVVVKREKQPAAAPTSDTRRHISAETEPLDEDDLMPHGITGSLTGHEVSSILRDSPNPAELVLELVQDEIRGGSGLQDSFLEICVLLFEELAKIQRPGKSQLQLKAREVAALWKERITIEAPKSSLEALAFLLFIVAYGLKTLINEEETALLASSVAQYEQAPRLFNYLSLNPKLREFVKELIEKSQYIPAVRIICLFKLDTELSFSPSELLKKEIINFRRPALENRSTESSQAKETDGERLRAIIELVADYKLEVDIPGDLIAKLMVQRESSTPLVRCSVERDTSSNPQAELKKKQTNTVLVKHNGVKEENIVMSSDVNSINETAMAKDPPIIYTYQRRGN